MRIAYLVNAYPSPSHSFIRREILALEPEGFDVRRFGIRPTRSPLKDPADRDEDRLTEQILPQGAVTLARALGNAGLTRPRALLAAAGTALAARRAAGRGTVAHLAYLAEAAYLARRCRALGIGHVHAHFGTNSATVAMLAARIGGLTWSFTVHGPEEFDRPEQLMLGEKIRGAAFTVAVSAFGRSQLCRWSDRADWERIRVVHCGIEPARFPAATPLPDGLATRLVSIGRFVEQKGQLLLVEALASALRQVPDLHLTLVGDGEMRPEIEAAIAAHEIGDKVTITGWVDEARVRAEIAGAHALVMPSFAEGLPMVVMEAMAAGRPVISTYIAGIPELVRPATGWLVPAGDPEALSEAMASLAATSRQELAEMGRAGRNRALQRHDIDIEARRLGQLFTALSGQEAAPAPRGRLAEA